jgi:hypothetical protein
MDSDDDMALQTLLAARAEVAPELDEKILRLCYAIQKKHQFSEDRAQSAAAMERLIDEAVAALSAAPAK